MMLFAITMFFVTQAVFANDAEGLPFKAEETSSESVNVEGEDEVYLPITESLEDDEKIDFEKYQDAKGELGKISTYSVVLGIISFIFGMGIIVSVPMFIAAIILRATKKKKEKKSKVSKILFITPLVLTGIPLVLFIVIKIIAEIFGV